MTADGRCPRCGARLLGGATEGLCPACLLRAAQELTTTAGDATIAAVSTHVGTRVRYVGDYELREEIARGGMGVVYKARQISLNRLVAVKMILSGHLADDEEVRRFRAEAEAAANLQHPNIVAIHEVGEHDGHHYFSMDYVEGKNLAQLADGRPLPADQAARYVKNIAEAIQFAHQRGILHRDLKPQNVLIDAHDQPRITDFGLAKRVDGNSTATRANVVMGSPSYMSPEQASGESDRIGPASDVYSLGAVLYELLTGRPPFRAESAMATMRQVIGTPPVAPHAINAGVSRDLETIALKCLEKPRDLRYPTARDLAEDLGRFINQEPIHAKPAGAGRRVAAWSRQRPWVFAAGASAVILVLLGLVDYLWEQTRYLNWVAAHPGYVRTTGPRTTWLKGPVETLTVFAWGAAGWSDTVLDRRFKRRFLLLPRPTPPIWAAVFSLISLSALCASVYAVASLIGATVWEGWSSPWAVVSTTFGSCLFGISVLSKILRERRRLERGAKPFSQAQLEQIKALGVPERVVDAIRAGDRVEAMWWYRKAASATSKEAAELIKSLWP